MTDALRAGTLAIDDPLAVLSVRARKLATACAGLSDRELFLLPLPSQRCAYTGNIRLSVADRDQGKLHFSYGMQPTDWDSDPPAKYTVLDASRNVTVRKLASFEYRVTFGDKAVSSS